MTTPAGVTIDPDEGELRDQAEHLASALGTPGRRARLVSPTGEQIELPTVIFEALAAIAEALREGDGVSIIRRHHMLTTNQAADLLNISRPYLLTLLRREEIPYERVGTHRRLRLDDVLAYRERRETQRMDALQNLVRQAEDLGLPY